jgi:transposase
MAAAIALRSDFTGPDLRRLARRTQDAKQARRLLALATIFDGGSRSDAARIGDVGLQIIRDWVLRFNAEGPDGLVDRKAPGPEPRLDEEHRTALAAVIESGPISAIHRVVRWRLTDLCQWLWEEFRVHIARQTLSRELRSLGYRKLTARPRHHAQAEGAIEHFKKSSLPSWQRSRRRRASSLPR